jgi:acetyl esterase/lipase
VLRPDLPATVILAGESDRFVLIERSRALADRIRAAGAQVDLLVAPFVGHGSTASRTALVPSSNPAVTPERGSRL